VTHGNSQEKIRRGNTPTYQAYNYMPSADDRSCISGHESALTVHVSFTTFLSCGFKDSSNVKSARCT
jgi:hypothetical protein